MKLLILGGTQFLGRHIVEEASARGWQVSLFNRGVTNPELFPDVEHLRGDRDSDLKPLAGREWDAVVDTCGYVPRIVGLSAQHLADSVGHYTFISSISVYPDTTIRHMDETAPVATLADESTEKVDGSTYGGLKALCEHAAEAAMPGRVLNARAGLIVGPHDPTDRFTYWPVRVALGGEVLAPGKPDMPVQIIDARDLAGWILNMAQARTAGVFNATGPQTPLTMRDVLETCQAVSGSDVVFTWVDDTFLSDHDVTPYTEMPLWLPEEYNGWQTISIQKALGAGLTFRPLADTIRDTLHWNTTRTGVEGQQAVRPGITRPRGGMMLDREAELLRAWHTQR